MILHYFVSFVCVFFDKHLGRIIIMTVARDSDCLVDYGSSGVLYDQQTQHGAEEAFERPRRLVKC